MNFACGAVAPFMWGVLIGVAAVVVVAVITSRQSYNQNHTHVRNDCDRCPVCLQPIGSNLGPDFTLRCSHKFHKDCLRLVFEHEVQKSCPVMQCRRLVEADVVKKVFS